MITPTTDRPQETSLITNGLQYGYGWVYGIHGIGKTSLVKNVLNDERFSSTFDFIYLDGRTEFYSFPDLTCSILNALEQKSSTDERENYRLLRSLYNTIPGRKRIRVIIDELDVYTPRQVQPVWNLALAHSRLLGKFGLFFISARPPSFFEDPNDPSSKPPSEEVPLYPLSVEATFHYFSHIEMPHRKVHDLIHFSGGNPTLMSMLAEMYIATNEVNIFDTVNRTFLTNVYSYFNNLWNALEEHIKWDCVYAAILFYNYANNTRHWQILQGKMTDWDFHLLSHRLGTMFSFGRQLPDFRYSKVKDLPSIISPIFLTWILLQKASKISQDFSDNYNGPNPLKSQNIFGLPLSAWQDASTAITTIGTATAIFQTLASIFK